MMNGPLNLHKEPPRCMGTLQDQALFTSVYLTNPIYAIAFCSLCNTSRTRARARTHVLDRRSFTKANCDKERSIIINSLRVSLVMGRNAEILVISLKMQLRFINELLNNSVTRKHLIRISWRSEQWELKSCFCAIIIKQQAARFAPHKKVTVILSMPSRSSKKRLLRESSILSTELLSARCPFLPDRK